MGLDGSWCNLDQKFREHDAMLQEISAWEALCITPKPARIQYTFADGFFIDNVEDTGEGYVDNRPPDLPIQSDGSEFFAAARALTGQYIGTWEHAYGVLAQAAQSLDNLNVGNERATDSGSNPADSRPDDGATGDGGGEPAGEYTSGLVAVLTDLFSSSTWKGDARDACLKYVGQLDKHITILTRQAVGLASAVSAYWAAIDTARANVIICMTELCKQLRAKEAADADQAAQQTVTNVGLLITAALAVAGLPWAGVAASASEVAALAKGIALLLPGQVSSLALEARKRQMTLTQGGSLYSLIAKSYFDSTDTVVRDLRTQLTGQLFDAVSTIRSDMTTNQPPAPGRAAADETTIGEKQFEHTG